jgi:hypothetical protein
VKEVTLRKIPAMRIPLIVFFVWGISLFSAAQLKPNIVESSVDTIEIFMEGPVIKKVGIFHHIMISNWNDLTNLPLVKTKVDLLANASNEWVQVGKAEIYRFNEKEKMVEIKLLEDLKPPKGQSNWSLGSKTKVRLRWKEVVE